MLLTSLESHFSRTDINNEYNIIYIIYILPNVDAIGWEMFVFNNYCELHVCEFEKKLNPLSLSSIIQRPPMQYASSLS